MTKDNVSLPTVTLAPHGRTQRPGDSTWVGLPQIHSDEDGGQYLVIPAQWMDITFSIGEDEAAAEYMEHLAKQLQENAAEIRENMR